MIFNHRLTMRLYRRIFTISFAIAVAFCASAVRAQYLHPRISAKQTVVRRVVLLPAKVEIVKQSMKGPEGMAGESDLLSQRVSLLLTEVLTAKRMTVAPMAENPDGGSEQKYTVADMQSRYDALLPKIKKKRKDVKKGRFSLGDEVLNLNLDKSTDAIVFIRGTGQSLTKGKTAFTLLVGGMPAYLQLGIAIVDAHTGEVLVYADSMTGGDATNPDGKRLRKAIEKSLKKLPEAF